MAVSVVSKHRDLALMTHSNNIIHCSSPHFPYHQNVPEGLNRIENVFLVEELIFDQKKQKTVLLLLQLLLGTSKLY